MHMNSHISKSNVKSLSLLKILLKGGIIKVRNTNYTDKRVRILPPQHTNPIFIPL